MSVELCDDLTTVVMQLTDLGSIRMNSIACMMQLGALSFGHHDMASFDTRNISDKTVKLFRLLCKVKNSIYWSLLIQSSPSIWVQHMV
jgi:hypothetical protein